MRTPHILEASKQTSVPRRMIFFDSESAVNVKITAEEISRAIAYQKGDKKGGAVRKDHDPYLICATYVRDRKSEGKGRSQKSRDYHKLNCTDFLGLFWSEVDKFAVYNQTTYMFAHNAKYDAQVTASIPHLVELGFNVVGFSDSNPLILEFEKHHADCGCKKCQPNAEDGKSKKKTLIMLSSTNYYSQSLAKLGDIFKLPKLDFDHDQEIKPTDPEFIRGACVYGRRDVEILTVAMLSFIDFIVRENMGKFAKTVAGQAFAAFRQRFLSTSIYIHDDKRALEVERRAYAGGRNECFQMGEILDRIFYLDINSMYPYVMQAFKYPTKLVSVWESATIQHVVDQIEDGKLICADALVSTREAIFHAKQDKLIFPVGTFWTTLTTPELVEAIKRGLLIEVKNVCIYEAGDIFTDYVHYFYTSRLEAKHAGDAVHDHLFKIFMNSLYGKFGQLNVHWERIGDADPLDVYMETIYHAETKERRTIKVFGGGIWEQVKDPDDEEAFNSFPAVAAHVTAYARMQLNTYIETAGRANVFYCDTDSILTNGEGFQNLWMEDTIDPDRLGALKLELSTERLQLHGCKDYEMDYIDKKGKMKHEVKIKGVSKNAVPLDPDERGRLRFAVTQWGGFSDRLKEGNMSDYYNRVIVKTLKREYNKGTIEEGGRVLPFELKEEELFEPEETDPIKLHGHIRTPQRGEPFYKAYDKIPRKAKAKYFRIDKGTPLGDWCSAAGVEVDEFLSSLTI